MCPDSFTTHTTWLIHNKSDMTQSPKTSCSGSSGASSFSTSSPVMCVDTQCVAVCCSVLQCVAVCCSVLQCVAFPRHRLSCVLTLIYEMLRLICETWLIHMWDMTHYEKLTLICETWLTYEMLTLICETWLIYERHDSYLRCWHSYVRHDSLWNVDIHMWDMTHTWNVDIHMWDMIEMWKFMHIWDVDIHMWDMTHLQVSYLFTLICETWLRCWHSYLRHDWDFEIYSYMRCWPSDVRYDSFATVIFVYIHICDMTYSYVWCDPLLCPLLFYLYH